MFRKIYLEITNICNLSCSFCHKTCREKKFMSHEEFITLTKKIRPYTDYLYLHLMGEPLLHPDFHNMLKTAEETGFRTTVATNGVLIDRLSDTLLSLPPYKVTFSLHSYEGNRTHTKSLEEYVRDIADFSEKAEKNGTICVLRLWNDGGEEKLNGEIMSLLRERFSFTENRSGFRLSDRIYLETAEKFIWPDLEAEKQEVRFCMGLRDHVGVLCDGSVVPCCLDAEGSITLGNLFSEELPDIISSPRARAIYDGFSSGRCTEELCSRCQYATRFR